MQATKRRSTVAHEQADLVAALYEIAVATRRLSPRDPVDTSAVRLLWHLAVHGTCRMSDLADAAGLDLSTVSRAVRDLGDAGYLTRTPDPHDRRAVLLELTDDGRGVLADAEANRAAALGPVLRTWSPEERTTLIRLLRALADDLTDVSATNHEDHA